MYYIYIFINWWSTYRPGHLVDRVTAEELLLQLGELVALALFHCTSLLWMKNALCVASVWQRSGNAARAINVNSWQYRSAVRPVRCTHKIFMQLVTLHMCICILDILYIYYIVLLRWFWILDSTVLRLNSFAYLISKHLNAKYPFIN